MPSTRSRKSIISEQVSFPSLAEEKRERRERREIEIQVTNETKRPLRSLRREETLAGFIPCFDGGTSASSSCSRSRSASASGHFESSDLCVCLENCFFYHNSFLCVCCLPRNCVILSSRIPIFALIFVSVPLLFTSLLASLQFFSAIDRPSKVFNVITFLCTMNVTERLD